MALAEPPVRDRLTPIVEAVSRAVKRHKIEEAGDKKARGGLRIELERDVKRVVQVYWTPFAAEVPGRSVGLHLEVADPKVRWAEAYLSPEFTNWVFCFGERADGDIQLNYHREYPSPEEAIHGFFNLASWYVLTAADLTWSDVAYEIGDGIDWPAHRKGLASEGEQKALQESLKKSTILWLRWRSDSGEQAMPVWYLFDNKTNKIYVLSGERQQTIPGAAELTNVDVIFRWKGKNARVAEVPAEVEVLEPGPEWDQVAEKIAEKRLNIPGLPEETAKRWREECVILELNLRI